MIALAIRAPYAFWSSPAELKVFSSLRVRKAMSNGPSRFRYAIGNALHRDIKGRKRHLSEPASDLQGHDLKVAVEAAAEFRDLRRTIRIAGSKRERGRAKSGA